MTDWWKDIEFLTSLGRHPDPKLLEKQVAEYRKAQAIREYEAAQFRWLYGKGPKPIDPRK